MSERVPDVAGELLGWKALRWIDGRLMSPSQAMPWPLHDWAVADCSFMEAPTPKRRLIQVRLGSPTEPPHHEAPDERCSCGIYAVTDPMGALNYLSHGCVLVRVAGVGRVIPGNRGWRAERARVVGIAPFRVDWDSARLIGKVAQAYGVPILDGPRTIHMEIPAEIVEVRADGELKARYMVKARVLGASVEFEPPLDMGGQRITQWRLPNPVTLQNGDQLRFEWRWNA